MGYTLRLIRQKEIAQDAKLFEFERPVEFSYTAGQAVDLTLLNPKFSDERGMTRTFTIASAPHEKILSIATRIGKSGFKRSLGALEVGEEVLIEGPFGSFGLSSDLSRPAVFMAGGIGITPFISMLRKSFLYRPAFSQRLSLWEKRKIFLFYVNRMKEEAAFLEELEEYGDRHKNFRFVPLYTAAKTRKTSDFERHSAILDQKFLATHLSAIKNPIFYVSGSLSFVVSMHDLILKFGATESSIRTDEFPGY